MEAPTTTHQLPVSGLEVSIRQWITFAQAEHIANANYQNLTVSAKNNMPEIDKIDIDKIINDEQHRTIEAFVASIGGKTEKPLEEFLQLPEDDGKYILDIISERRKKKSQADTQDKQ